MQTRKRAKSVMFGKKAKEKKETTEEKVVTPDSEKTAEKAEIVERRVVPEKPQNEELSVTPPHSETELESPSSTVTTPTDEFVTDSNPISTSPEEQKEEKNEIVDSQSENIVLPPTTASETPQSVDSSVQSAQPTVTPESAGQQADSQELSSTLPPSAFTIQSEEAEPVKKPEEVKKRFGVYFLVVAFLAFILGLGAMAAASYFGFVKTGIPGLTSRVHIPTIHSPNPTPTVPPPTAIPTQKPVDLTAFTISILNGSGVSGKAASVKASLTVDGFKVTSTGNAATNDFTKTEIAAKSTVDKAYLTKLEDSLKKSFVLDTSIGSLSASSPTDVTVTLGSQTE